MQAKPNYLRIIILTMICFLLLAAFFSALPLAQSREASVAPADQVFRAHIVDVKPIIYGHDPVQTAPGTMGNASATIRPVRFACQNNDHPQPALCYGPYQVRQAYDVNNLLNKNITGKGSTITIVDAYGSPTIRKDLQAFDMAWGLPSPRLKIIAPFGVLGSDGAWVAETSLDVEWAHAMAPNAAINLVVARTSNDVEIYKALSYAVRNNLGDVISLSFGENEMCVDPKLRRAEHRVFIEAVNKGMTLLAATGDFGSAQLTCDSNSYQKAVSFPSDDPLVTAVGGSALIADAVSGRYIRETAWNESSAFNKASGGGYSKIYAAPPFQRGVLKTAPGRAVPDIALNASVNGGVLVFQSHRAASRPTVNIMGGTSVAAPELAGILADGVQIANHRLGRINPDLYKLGASASYNQAMNDITTGDNALLSSGLNGYKAGVGWDPATGWGSPRHTEIFLRALLGGVSEQPVPTRKT